MLIVTASEARTSDFLSIYLDCHAALAVTIMKWFNCSFDDQYGWIDKAGLLHLILARHCEQSEAIHTAGVILIASRV